MADALSQDSRSAELKTPLGADVLALVKFTAVEALSELFEIRIESASTQGGLDFASALGEASSVTMTTQDDQKRHFNGVLTEARWAGSREDLHLYELVLRPWLWLLTRTSDCRIFAQMSPIDIIKQVFSDRGFSDFRDATTGSPPTLEYCVQYRETDFHFVSRLMEEYGVYYFFEHSEDKHTLVLADAKSSHKPVPGLSSASYNPTDDAGRRQQQYLDSWSLGRSAQSGRYTLEDYGYKKPSANLLAEAQAPGGYTHDSMEMFDYPYSYVDKEGGNLIDKSVGEAFAKYRLEALQSLDKRRAATGAAASLFPGALVNLKDYPDGDENKEYLVTRCWHSFEDQSYRSGGGGSPGYAGRYELTPSDRQFRAPLATRKPEIAGFQSALVVGDGEVDVDKLGRTLVQFYWDRKKKPSRRVRVAQIWAGKTRGALFTPRVGDEVLIAYEEGDPDRPIVIGSVYNGTNTVPMTLPEKKVKSGVLTQSSTGGGGYNMLLFDDTKGAETVKLRAQKDLMFKALNNERRDILNSQTENVGQDETINVGFPAGSGKFTLNAFSTVTINVGPQGSPMTQIVMDTSSITLNVGPEGMASQIVMSMEGITLSVMEALSSVAIQPDGVTIMAPTVTVIGEADVNVMAPTVNVGAILDTPELNAAAATVSGIPL